MKLLIQTAMIFFGTLLCAGVVALGEPGPADVTLARASDSVMRHMPQRHSAAPRAWIEIISASQGFSLR